MLNVTGGHVAMPSRDSAELGRLIRQAREAMGWSQDDLARALNVDRTTVGKWEFGAREPDFATLRALCRLLGLPPEQVLDGHSESENIAPEVRLRRLGMTLRGAGLRDHEVEYVLAIIKERQAERKQRKERKGQE